MNNQIRGTWTDWFSEQLRNSLGRFHYEEGETDQKFVLWVTIVPRRNINIDSPAGAYELNILDRIFRHVCQKIYGRRYNRHPFKNRVPFVVGFSDSEGSKYATSVDEPKNIHVHSIWACDPAMNDEIIQIFNCIHEKGRLAEIAIDSIHAEIVAAKDIPNLVSYSQKWQSIRDRMDKNSKEMSDINSEFRILPTWVIGQDN